MNKLWAGRSEAETSALADAFNSSIAVDGRMYQQDITGSMAHAAMLAKCGILTQADADQIIGGLAGILADLQSGALQLDMQAEDIHMFVEAELTSRIGDVGKKLHTARSRNDQVALDLRLYLKDEIAALQSLVLAVISSLHAQASAHKDTIMPGYTHLQRAQPITFGQQLLAYAMMLERDYGRPAGAWTPPPSAAVPWPGRRTRPTASLRRRSSASPPSAKTASTACPTAISVWSS